MVVTPLYAGILALALVILSLRLRDPANFLAFVLALVLMLILELSRFSIYLIHALGIALVIACFFHSLSMSPRADSPSGRSFGAAMTFAILIVEAVLCLYQAWLGHYVWLRT